MTKTFLTVILFLLSLALLAIDSAELLSTMDNTQLDLTYGIKRPATQPWDFTNKYYYANWRQIDTKLYVPMEAPGHSAPYNAWYMADFAEDPFDGRIEVMTMGEPLPPARVTLLIMLSVVGIIYWNRFKLNRSAA